MKGIETDALLGSFASAAGLALGELLLFAGRPEALRGCLGSIETAAYATLLMSDSGRGARCPGGRSLGSAALRVVRAWHEEADDMSFLAEAIQGLQEVLEAMGIRYVPAPFAESSIEQ